MIKEMDRFLGHPSSGLDDYISSYMKRVPFENIDVQNKVPISVELEDIFDKIITRGRGGFCYEMNTLFRRYLNAKGYYAYNVSATVKHPDGWTREGSHMSTLVKSGELYVADVGFGDLPLKAMPIRPMDEAVVIEDVNGRYRAVETDGGFEVQKDRGQGFETLYRGGFTPREIEAFQDNLEYNQHHPDSIFVRKLIITQPKSDGRVSMSESSLTITQDGKKEKYDVNGRNYRKFLKEHFDLDVEIKRFEK
jgi:arylamine N-acetyltransferase